MRILIEGPNWENYYAKVHESFKNGLKALFDARCYGEGYPNFDKNRQSILDIKEVVFPGMDIDLVIFCGGVNKSHLEYGFAYEDVEKLECKKAILINDFWSEIEPRREQFFDFIIKNDVDYLFTLFRAPFYLWENTDIYERLLWRPVCFDPKIFNDWEMEKIYDVGNLNAGMFRDNGFYHERFVFHKKLLEMEDISYFYAQHPGDGMLPPNADLIGKKFSEAINRCKIFVTSGNMQYKNFAPKYVEIMASGSMLMATEPCDAEMLGLIDGVNYVVVDENSIQEKVRYYLAHEEERESITKRGYALAMERYTSYAIAGKIGKDLTEKMQEVRKTRGTK